MGGTPLAEGSPSKNPRKQELEGRTTLGHIWPQLYGSFGLYGGEPAKMGQLRVPYGSKYITHTYLELEGM